MRKLSFPPGANPLAHRRRVVMGFGDAHLVESLYREGLGHRRRRPAGFSSWLMKRALGEHPARRRKRRRKANPPFLPPRRPSWEGPGAGSSVPAMPTLAAVTVHPSPRPLPPRVERRLAHWLEHWGTPSLASRLRVEFSPRLTRAFGRCYQSERLIRLTPSLLDSQSALLDEILCHEAAHAAVYERWGSRARPHGVEWEGLMRKAGFEPRVRIPVVVRSTAAASSRRLPRYDHRCPVCKLSRSASRPRHDWRCRLCLGRGGEGRLVVRRIDAARQAKPSDAPARKGHGRATANGRAVRTANRAR